MKKVLNKLFGYESLTKEEARVLLHQIAEGKYNDIQISALMTAFLMRNISLDELDGFYSTLMELRKAVMLDEFSAVDIVGTGGDDTFNISTCASFVVAAAGYPVVKHGNYGMSSISGASNVIESCGVKFTNNTDKIKYSIEKCGIAYLHAPLFNAAMKSVANARKCLGVRSFFNILGPLVNPASPQYQLLGVYNLESQRLYNYVFQNQNANYAVVHSMDGYDEISLTSPFKVCSVLGERIYTPEELGLSTCSEKELYGGETPQAAAEIFKSVLNNRSSIAQRDCVIANAAFAIKVVSPLKSIQECMDECREALISGRANETLKKFIELNS